MKCVITPRYQVALEFSPEGIAEVADQQGWAHIDTRGRIVIRPSVVDNGPDYFAEDMAGFTHVGKEGLFDRQSKVVVEPGYDFAIPLSEGHAAICRGCAPIQQGEHVALLGG